MVRGIFALIVAGIVVSLASALASDIPTSANIDVLLARLNAFNTRHYTGGLPRRNRALAEQIRAAMQAQFPAIACGPHDPMQGVLVGLDDEAAAKGETPANIDPNLAALLKAADSARQEVRDTAVYTIGLIGPSARDAEPFLRKRFAGNHEKSIKGNWHNDAYGKVICAAVGPPDVRQLLPDNLLPAEEPWVQFLSKVAVLLPRLYLDEDIEYPPGLLAYTYSNYGIDDEAAAAVPFLVRILQNERLSNRKRIDVVGAVSRLPESLSKPALPALLSLSESKDADLRESAGAALIQLNHKAAIPFLIKRVEQKWDHWSWRGLCDFGPEAIRAEDALLVLMQSDKTWPSDARGAAEVLGCVRSVKAIPVLLAKLSFPDWETQAVIARSLGSIGDTRANVVAALERLATAHWSKIVREAADKALGKLGLRPVIPDAEIVEEVVVGGPPLIDHGLPRCDDGGRVSIGRGHWFRAQWTKHTLAAVPKGFTGEVAEFGTREFVRVEDGWLFGSDLWHYDGKFQHVLDSGAITELDEPRHTNLRGFVRRGDVIYAYGLQILKSGQGGVLFEVVKNDGKWAARRIAALPSPPSARASGPHGEMLFRDHYSDYAVIENEVVPLKCQAPFVGERDKR